MSKGVTCQPQLKVLGQPCEDGCGANGTPVSRALSAQMPGACQASPCGSLQALTAALWVHC